jgi:hypothetical protein
MCFRDRTLTVNETSGSFSAICAGGPSRGCERGREKQPACADVDEEAENARAEIRSPAQFQAYLETPGNHP